MKGRQRLALYPFLFALYPALFLYARNMHLVSFSDCIKPAAILLVVTFVLLVLGRAVLKNNVKSGILVSFALLLFFGYGHVVDSIVAMNPPFRVGLLVFPLWGILMLLVVVLVVRTRRTLDSVAAFMRVVAVALVAMTAIQTLTFRVRPGADIERVWDRWVARSVKGDNALKLKSNTTPPDIYYIILDAYAGPEVLAEEFGIDITPFIDQLTRQGFYVASKSACNYYRTDLSLPSSLNLDYVDKLEEDSGVSPRSLPGQRAMFRRPKVVELLRNAGYRIVMIPSDYAGLKLADPDIVLRKSKFAATEFDLMLIESSVLRVLPWMGARSWRSGMLGNLDRLGKVPDIKGPTFTIAHLVVTHPPFCFESDGSMPDRVLSSLETLELSRQEYGRLYAACVTYLNSRLETIVRDILAKSETPPIILLQADHGAVCPFKAARARIFNAYYLPDGGDQLLYPTITPVNTFRVVFNHYFGTDYQLLEDRSYSHEKKNGEYTFRVMDPSRRISPIKPDAQ